MLHFYTRVQFGELQRLKWIPEPFQSPEVKILFEPYDQCREHRQEA